MGFPIARRSSSIEPGVGAIHLGVSLDDRLSQALAAMAPSGTPGCHSTTYIARADGTLITVGTKKRAWCAKETRFSFTRDAGFRRMNEQETKPAVVREPDEE